MIFFSFRFQTPYFWPSNCWEPENTDYAVYLCKRTMQNKTRLELADYEAENLAKLQKMFSRKWEFIFMQVHHFKPVSRIGNTTNCIRILLHRLNPKVRWPRNVTNWSVKFLIHKNAPSGMFTVPCRVA